MGRRCRSTERLGDGARHGCSRASGHARTHRAKIGAGALLLWPRKQRKTMVKRAKEERGGSVSFNIEDFDHPEVQEKIAGLFRRATQDVIAAVIVDGRGRVFLHRRSMESKNFPGLWQCPGRVAIGRGVKLADDIKGELRGEWGVEVRSVCSTPTWVGAICGYGNSDLRFRFVRVVVYRTPRPIQQDEDTGECRLALGVESGWFTIREAEKLAMSPPTALAWPSIVAEVREAR